MNEKTTEPVAWMRERPPERGIDKAFEMTTVKEIADKWPDSIPLYTKPQSE